MTGNDVPEYPDDAIYKLLENPNIVGRKRPRCYWENNENLAKALSQNKYEEYKISSHNTSLYDTEEVVKDAEKYKQLLIDLSDEALLSTLNKNCIAKVQDYMQDTDVSQKIQAIESQFYDILASIGNNTQLKTELLNIITSMTTKLGGLTTPSPQQSSNPSTHSVPPPIVPGLKLNVSPIPDTSIPDKKTPDEDEIQMLDPSLPDTLPVTLMDKVVVRMPLTARPLTKHDPPISKEQLRLSQQQLKLSQQQTSIRMSQPKRNPLEAAGSTRNSAAAKPKPKAAPLRHRIR